ncbi:gliding motility-associated C-terminal domain-containing protein [bacterium SCSIO 12741]|nr:gliding motility-associated C-terminal domain-containing protein [bacterium SCSIO 12741]
MKKTSMLADSHLIKWTLMLFMAITGLQLLAQKETNYWYFGKHAGLNFNKITNGLPEVLSDGEMYAYEANATLSDRNGNLLFYTDGRYVFDANHDTMPNGKGLLGNMSCTQSIIVPNPGNSNKFYVFHNDYHAYVRSVGFSYTEVDLSLRGGLGDVIPTSKNISLADTIAERIAAVKMKGRNGYWVVVHKYQENGRPTNVYLSYEVTSAGVNPVPVVSRIGPIPTGNVDYVGAFKFSGCGDKIATAFEGGTVILMDFDAFTGQFSNARSHKITIGTHRVRTYGIEFSEDGDLLYVGVEVRNDQTKTKILQYSATSTTSAAFSLSAMDITDPMLESIRGMQRGSDGKIYFVYGGANVLGILHDPNVRGVGCNLDPNGLSLPGNTDVNNSLGLPNFLCTFFCPDPRIEAEDYCLGQPTLVELAGSLEQVDSVHFNFGDPNSQNNFSNDVKNAHLYSASGRFDIAAIVYYTYGGVVVRDTLYRTIEIVDVPQDFLGPDTVICFGDTLTLNQSAHSVTILDDQMNSVTAAHRAGTYYGKIEIDGCFGYDTLEVDSLPATTVVLGPDTLMCRDELVLQPYRQDTLFTYEWHDGWKEPQRTINAPGVYTLTASGPCGQAIDTLLVEDECRCEVLFPNVFTPNGDGYNDLFKPVHDCEVEYFRFTMYNRWGLEVYSSAHAVPTWTGEFQGKKCTSGVYFWEVEYQQKDEPRKSQSGHLMLMGISWSSHRTRKRFSKVASSAMPNNQRNDQGVSNK